MNINFYVDLVTRMIHKNSGVTLASVSEPGEMSQ